MRSAALLVALYAVIAGVAGLISPDTVMTVRRVYLATPDGLMGVGAVYFGIGVVLILSATASRSPKILRTLGGVMCVRGLVAPFIGVDRALAILDFEANLGNVAGRLGSVAALIFGGFIAWAVKFGQRSEAVAK